MKSKGSKEIYTEVVNGEEYSFSSKRQLSILLGKNEHYVTSVMKSNPDFTFKDVILFVKSKYNNVVEVDGVEYKFSTKRELSKLLGEKDDFISTLMSRYPEYDYKDAINHTLFLRHHIKGTTTVEVDGIEYSFTSNSDLSRQLGRCSTYVNTFKREHPDYSYEDIIRQSKGISIAKERKRIKVCVNGIEYSFSTETELSKLLGVDISQYFYFKKKHPELNHKDIIEYFKTDVNELIEGKRYKIDVNGKEFAFDTDQELSLLLGMDDNYVCNIKNDNSDISYKDIIKSALKLRW